MTRVEYIQQLEFSLSGKLLQREISEILRDYSEYFEAGRSEGKSEEEIAMNLGIPSAVAAQILSEIEEEAAGNKEKGKKEIPPSLKELGKKSWSFLKKLLSFMSGFFGDLFDKLRPSLQRVENAYSRFSGSASGQANPPAAGEPAEPGAQRQPGYDPYPPPPSKPSKKQRRQADPGPKHPPAPKRHGFLSVLAGICMLPFIFMACCIGAALLALLSFGILALVALMGALFLFFLAAILTGGALFSVAGGLGLPLSFHLLFIIALAFCLAGSILSVCGAIYLVKGLVRLIRGCFGSVHWASPAHNPVYRAKTANVYDNGWDAPTPPPGPQPDAGQAEEDTGTAPTEEERQRYEQLLQEPIPEPKLRLNEEGPSFGSRPAKAEEEEEKGENSHA